MSRGPTFIYGNFNRSGVGGDSGTRRVGEGFLTERGGVVARGSVQERMLLTSQPNDVSASAVV